MTRFLFILHTLSFTAQHQLRYGPEMKSIKLFGSIVLLLVAINCVTFTDSCSMPKGWKPPTTIQSLRGADVILYGKIKETYPHYRGSTAYTANMEVYCVLRGPRTPKFVNITHAGYMPGMCTATELQKGGVYLVPLFGKDASSLQGGAGASFKEPGQIEEAQKACDLNRKPTYPRGSRKNKNKVKCPSGLPAGKCKNE